MLKLIFSKDDFFLQNKISVISGSTSRKRCQICNSSTRNDPVILLRVTSEYHCISFHYMILRDYIHLRVSSEYFSFGAHIMKLVSLL